MNLICDSFRSLRINVGYHNGLCALFGKTQAERAANAIRAARNNGNSSLNLHGRKDSPHGGNVQIAKMRYLVFST
jgi:hypothetical protein